ncbi:MAG: dTDP-4-dehydrorhamnose 3,5-epimerase [Raineya sp.]
MPFLKTAIPDLLLFEPRLFEDERGYFYESFNQKEFREASSIDLPFVQDNHSFSKYGVIRGLHFQKPPHEQAKLIKVVQGEIYDVVVDLRKNSTTFGKWLGFYLSAQNKKQLYVPRGFAHGFVVLSPTAEVLYKCDNFYAPQSEGGVIFDDKTLAINWLLERNQLLVSEKDLKLPTFSELYP